MKARRKCWVHLASLLESLCTATAKAENFHVKFVEWNPQRAPSIHKEAIEDYYGNALLHERELRIFLHFWAIYRQTPRVIEHYFPESKVFYLFKQIFVQGVSGSA